MKAAFVYNFLKFVDWPDGTFQSAEEPLVVGIVGDGATANATAALLSAKLVRFRELRVRRLRWDEPLRGVHALFVGEGDAASVLRVLDSARATPILLISDTPGFATQGGTIELVVERQKVRFEVNTRTAADAQLRVSSKLLALARTVYHNDASQAQRR